MFAIVCQGKNRTSTHFTKEEIENDFKFIRGKKVIG